MCQKLHALCVLPHLTNIRDDETDAEKKKQPA